MSENGNQILPDPGQTAARLFISYSRSDAAWAKPLITLLEQAGHQLWWDGMLKGGENFLPTTQAALEGADAVVVLWSKASVDSHWVRDEATVGRDRRRLVPLSIDGSMPPLGFRQFQLLDLSRWNGKASAPEFQQVIDAIAAVSGQPAPARAVQAPPAAPGINRRWLLGAGAAAAAGIGAVAAWRWQAGGADASEPENSIAVLPFRNLSGQPGQDYFAEGLTEELRTTLSLNRQLLVSGAASAGGFRTADANAAQAAAKLGVSNLLMGSVRQIDDRIRITARLVDGRNGIDRWAESFERAVADVLVMQAEIATRVADALISSLAQDRSWSARRPGGTDRSEAFDAYARGQALYAAASGPKEEARALEAINRAIAIDPGYAAAHAARARIMVALANTETSLARATAGRAEALASARQAIALAPAMPEGHAALGYLLMSGLDIVAAREPYRKSFDLGQGNAPILAAFAEFAANTGMFDQANAAIDRAIRLDPLNAAVFRSAGLVNLAQRRMDQAAGHLRTALSLNPRLGAVHRLLGDMALVAGDAAAAAAHYDKEPGRLSRLRGLAITDARLKGQAAGDARMAELVDAYGDGGLYQQGEVLAQWGRIEPALSVLERAFALRDAGLVLAATNPLLDPLRTEPRFRAVLERCGLPLP